MRVLLLSLFFTLASCDQAAVTNAVNQASKAVQAAEEWSQSEYIAAIPDSTQKQTSLSYALVVNCFRDQCDVHGNFTKYNQDNTTRSNFYVGNTTQIYREPGTKYFTGTLCTTFGECFEIRFNSDKTETKRVIVENIDGCSYNANNVDVNNYNNLLTTLNIPQSGSTIDLSPQADCKFLGE